MPRYVLYDVLYSLAVNSPELIFRSVSQASMALNSLLCADVPLRTYTLTHTHKQR